MAQTPGKPSKKVKSPAQSATGLRDAIATGGQDIVSKAMQKEADDIARLEQTLKQTAKKAAAKKGAPLASEVSAADAAIEPVAADAQPVVAEPISAEPVSTAPFSIAPMFAEPGPAEPGPSEAVSAKLVAVSEPEASPGVPSVSEQNTAVADFFRPWSFEPLAVLNLDDLADGMVAIHRVALDALQANARLTMDFYKTLAGVRTFADAMSLQAALTRDSLDAISEQARGLRGLTGKIAFGARRQIG